MLQTNSVDGSNRIPVSIITGFLGSGKTTLLNHLVKQPGMESTALIINEFGEVGLDNLLVETSIENTLLLENGCICCSIRGDLIDTIGDLFAKARNGQIPDFDKILIETTGVADPAPIVNTIQGEVAVSNRCRLDGVVTLVDGVQGEAQANSHAEAMMQMAQADLALISKTDLAPAEKVTKLRRFIQAVNPSITIEPMSHGRIAPEKLFGLNRLQTEPAIDHQHHGNDHDADHNHTHEHASEHGHGHGQEHQHDHGGIATWSYTDDTPIDKDRLLAWLRTLYSLRAPSMLRMKGFVRTLDQDKPLLIQAVGPVLSPIEQLQAWPDGQPLTRLVFIFRDMSVEQMRGSFLRHVSSSIV